MGYLLDSNYNERDNDNNADIFVYRNYSTLKVEWRKGELKINMGMTFFALEMLQSVVLFGTLAAGFLVLLFLMLDNCKHTVITVVIVTTGLVHELYCASVLGYFKRLMQIETLRPKDDGCRDFFVPTLIANAIFVTIITTHVVRAGSFIRNKSTVYNLIVVHALLSISLIIWQNPEKSLHQTASMNLTSDVQVYFTVCRNNVVQNSSHILMEYILYYLPLVCFYVWTASQLSTADAGIVLLLFKSKSSVDSKLSFNKIACHNMAVSIPL